ncbi:MAG TPA: CBS domain-containing protein [Ignavibacteria bacterium]|nr:CBS domain-containing protein [Ignavibacteria bacterium]
MKVKDIMSKKFITVDIEAQLKKVLTILSSNRIDFAIVTNNNNKIDLIGLVSFFISQLQRNS